MLKLLYGLAYENRNALEEMRKLSLHLALTECLLHFTPTHSFTALRILILIVAHVEALGRADPSIVTSFRDSARGELYQRIYSRFADVAPREMRSDAVKLARFFAVTEKDGVEEAVPSFPLPGFAE
jgi:hypothetical protein